MRRLRSLTVPAALMLGLGLSWACDSSAGALGSPCETEDDCDDDLICDEHDGKASCQPPHDHGDDDDSDDEPDSTTSTTGDASTTGTTSSTTEGDTAEGSTGGTGGSTGDDGSELEQACTTLCACVDTNCSEYSRYPFAEPGSCMEACMTYSMATAACFNSFCEDVPGSGDLAEHNCEHAWGQLGQLEC